MTAMSRRIVVAVVVTAIVAASLIGAFAFVARANGVTPAFLADQVRYVVSRIGKSPRQPPEPADTRDERWRQDLAYLSTELPRLHANAFHQTSRSEFLAAVADLDARIPDLADHEIHVALMRIVALIGDGHTSTWTWMERFARYPLSLRWIDDGLHVVASGEGHDRLLGARVTRIGGTPVEEALARVRGLVSFDSEGHFLGRAAHLLSTSEILHAVGLQERIDAGTWTVKDRGGNEVQVEIASVPAGNELTWGAVVPTPRYRERSQDDFWWQRLATEGIVYLKIHRCRDPEGFRRVAEDVLASVDATPGAALVVDMRGNGGGDESVIAPLLEGVAARGLGAAGRLWVLTDAGTFSSATGNTASLRALGARSAGEPTGDGVDGYGEVKRLTLGNSGIEVVYSTRYWRRSGSEAPLVPDLIVRPSVDDVLAGRDPVLAGVRATIRGE